MDPYIARIIGEPYSTPAATPEPAPPPPEPAVTGPGLLICIIPGFLLLLVGYLASNVFAIADLYHVGFGPDDEFIPSPFAFVFSTPLLQWLFYAVTAAAAIAGCVLIGSQNFNPMAVVCYVLCPLVGLVFLVGLPLRIGGRFAVPIATIYLGIGTCLAGAGLTQLVSLYGRSNLEFEPMLASLLTEAGAALLIGALLKLWRSDVFAAPAVAQTDSNLAGTRS